MATHVNIENLSARLSRVSISLNEIALAASQIKILASEVVASPEQAVDFGGIIQSLAERIGWMSDLSAFSQTGGIAFIGGAEDWMMPPAYHVPTSQAAEPEVVQL